LLTTKKTLIAKFARKNMKTNKKTKKEEFPVKLDELDKKILKELQRDCLQSSRTLGKKLKIPATTIHHRKKQLEEKGVIRKYYAKVDPVAVGLNASALLLVDTISVHNMLEQNLDEEELGMNIAKLPSVVETHYITGEHDILVRFCAKNDLEIGQQLMEKMRKIRAIDRTYTIHIGQTVLNNRELTLEEISKKEVYKSSIEPVKLDEIDKKILRELQENCLQSSRVLGQKLDIPPTTVHHRKKHLEEKGIIIGYCADVNPVAIGLTACAFIFITLLSPTKLVKEGIQLSSVLKSICSIPNATELYYITGPFHLALKVYALSEQKMMEDVILGKIWKVPGISNTQTFGVTRNYLDSPTLPIA